MTIETWQLAFAAAILGVTVGMIGLRVDNAPGDEHSDYDPL